MHMQLRNRPIGERLAEILRKAILDGELPPGTEIRQEALAKQHGISRIPVREALQLLERDGFLVMKPNRRAVVAGVSDGDLKDHYEVRALVEGALARRAAENLKDPQELQDAHLIGEQLMNSTDASALVRANEIFHRAVWEAAESARLYSIANQLWTGIPPYRVLLLPSGANASIQEHSMILEAIITHNPESAQKRMSDHILGARDDVLNARKASDDAGRAPSTETPQPEDLPSGAGLPETNPLA
ncbi:GntR family transcriptional regulator [Nesterenkonia alkaliphila]|uniref:FCD domain-containing protein n=1 Tax=Nesterenkonia alkaliphila TaxID=1463631 RepID=A0A7K1UEN9_9MICC|nr:GntR family transcriptional regulator [Nesterenkonia alkaliphila]MVT24836.1 FCD domain-containing protein [Nesterenkonia alkaliphila]GFZ92888.1 GntR family transcriptional regulator [Nesterenkonia alkaliphila]